MLRVTGSKVGGTFLLPRESLLQPLLALIEELPLVWSPARRGRPYHSSQRWFLKAGVGRGGRHLPTVHALVAVLNQPEMAGVRVALSEQGHVPTRRTFERRLKAVPTHHPEQIAQLGDFLLRLLDPWATGGRAVKGDGPPLSARGGVRHRKHREAGEIPHTSMDPDAHWTKLGWHGGKCLTI